MLVSNTFGTGFLYVPYVLLVKKKEKKKEKNKDDQTEGNRLPKNITTNNNLQKI
jgi:hypothetical protein